jgi:hypothetical protein
MMNTTTQTLSEISWIYSQPCLKASNITMSLLNPCQKFLWEGRLQHLFL